MDQPKTRTWHASIDGKKKWQEYLSLQYLHIDGLSWELRILSDHFVLSMIIIILIYY